MIANFYLDTAHYSKAANNLIYLFEPTSKENTLCFCSARNSLFASQQTRFSPLGYCVTFINISSNYHATLRNASVQSGCFYLKSTYQKLWGEKPSWEQPNSRNCSHGSRTRYFMGMSHTWLSVSLDCDATWRIRTSKSFPTEWLATISNTIMGMWHRYWIFQPSPVNKKTIKE